MATWKVNTAVQSSSSEIQYFIFDVESVADGQLISRLRYPGEDLEPKQAVDRYRSELMEKRNSDFIPYTFQIPVSVVVAKVTENFELKDLVALDDSEFRPHVITEHFWRGWEKYSHPTLVTFNGRTFDVPLLELAAFHYGISIPGWFNVHARSFEQARNRYNVHSHLDLQDLLTNFGSTRFNGGLNLAANLIGKPGKLEVQGNMVQDMYDQGKLVEINDYCRCDVLDTYFVFLRSQVLMGRINRDVEHGLIDQAHQWLVAKGKSNQGLTYYLEHWGDWHNPWKSSDG